MHAARRFVFVMIGVIVAVTPLFALLSPVKATISSCTVSVDSSSMTASSSKLFVFSISNGGSGTANWIQLTSNSANQTIDSGSSGSWGYQTPDASTITFVSGTLGSGSSGNFNVTVNSGSSQGDANWTVEMSDESDGSNAVTCTGSTTITVSGTGAPTISNVNVSNVASTSVTISYTTDVDTTSTANYGTDDGYGETSTDSTSSTSHTHSITGLTANTTYHYSVTAESEGGSASSDDATFTTALSASATSTPGPTATPRVTTNTVTLPTPTPTPDKKAPVVTLQKLPDQPYKDAPTLRGNAVDNDAVSSVEYSVNDGKSWTRIKTVTGLNSSTAEFTLSPSEATEGKNDIKVRAKDNSGNIGISNAISIVLDKSGPKASLSTDFSHPFVTSPAITGVATDSSGESSVEYSLDGGKSWLPVDKITTKSTTETEFSFTPSLFDDGNYPVVVRAKDPLGNTSDNTTGTLIIDRLPPRVGGFLLSIGPQILEPKGNEYITLPDIIHTLTVSFVGGPTNVSATITPLGETIPSNGQEKKQTISFHRVGSSQLWTADVILPSAGQFTLAVRAEDGGKNILEKELIHIMALTPGTITSQAGATQKATITIYTKDNLTGSFIPWDAAAYGQQNPQKTSEKGTFSFYPPPGTYYLDIHRGFGYSDVVTSTFVTTAAIPISPPIVLPKSHSLTIFGISIPLPSLFRQHISFSLPEEPEPIADIAKETSKVMPEHLFTDIDPSRTFSGHTTHVVLLNTWAPQTPSQIQILEELHVQKPEVNFLVIFPQESKSAIELFAKRGGYTIPLRADPDGTFLEEISYPSIPTFYTMDDKMFLSSQKTGIQPAESL